MDFFLSFLYIFRFLFPFFIFNITLSFYILLFHVKIHSFNEGSFSFVYPYASSHHIKTPSTGYPVNGVSITVSLNYHFPLLDNTDYIIHLLASSPSISAILLTLTAFSATSSTIAFAWVTEAAVSSVEAAFSSLIADNAWIISST